MFEFGIGSKRCVTTTLVNLCNKTADEKRRQTLCQKRDNNFCLRKFFSKLHPPLKRFFRKKSKDMQVMPLSRLSHIDVLACSSILSADLLHKLILY